MNNDKILFRHEQPHGPGEVQLAWQTGGSGALLATTGADGTVAIYNRKGQLHERIILNGTCTGFGWDSDGDLLGMITLNSLQVTVWNVHTAKKQTLDLNLRDNPTCMVWAKRDPILAIATLRGNLSLYNYATTKRVSVIGKHSKRVTCGCWSSEGLLALAGEDRSLSVSTVDGDTLRVVPLRDTPYDVTFADMKTDERTQGENTISVILGKKTLFLYNLLDAENPIELGFQQKYGPLQIHKWFGDGYILLGFGAGHIVAISTHMQEVGQELFMVKSHKGLLDMSLAPLTSEVASCGDNNVKIHSTSNLHETLSIISPADDSMVYHVAWNVEGSLLALTTARGAIQVHVARLPPMGAACAPAIAILSSIAQVTVYHHYGTHGPFDPFTLPLEIEPSFIALSNRYLAVAMNNRIWLYQLPSKQDDNTILLGDRELMSNIKKLYINNNYMAVIHGGKLSLQMLVPVTEANTEREAMSFPDVHIQDEEVTCADLTQYFLVYGTDMGHIILFSINDWTLVREYRHDMGIKSVHSDPTGTWIVVQDDRGDGYVYNPASEKIVSIPDFPSGCKGVLWDQAFSTRHIFVVHTQTNIHLFVYIAQAVNGTRAEKIHTVPKSHDELPLQLSDGEITYLISGGKITTLDIADAGTDTSNEKMPEINNVIIGTNQLYSETMLDRLIALKKLNDAWNVCEHLNKDECWEKLGKAAIEHLNIEFAISVYRHLGDVSMVWSLEKISSIEELKLLCGHCAMILGLIEEACRYFQQSSQPQEALWLRRDLLQWQPALELAKRVDVTEFPFIAREYAAQLEFTGNFPEALQHFNEGLIDEKSCGDYIARSHNYNGIKDVDEHNALCMNGIARNSIRCGDIKKGLSIATRSNNKQLAKECADILLELKQFSEAAEMYERADLWDQAAAIYIQLNSWNKVTMLLDKVISPKIHLQYAQAKEKAALYEDAATAYAAAKDYTSVIRIQLEHLNNPHAAVELLEQNPSNEGAQMVARFYQRINDHESAMKFLVISGCNTEAYELARRHGLIQDLGQLLLAGSGTSTDFRQLAEHFEAQASSLLAGKYYFYARDFSKALKHLLKASALSSAENEALSLAVDTVASSNDEKLVAHLIEFLLGETDGIPKDPKYLFRLYMARKQFKESAKAAVIIANQEQINGNYRSAHDVLFSMYQELRHNDIPVPLDMRNSLNLLHSYILVRLHVKRGDHEKAARLLLRVASNISKFPQHVVPILTSTVIECHRSGLKQSAFSYAATLMRPEYRSQIDPKYAKKIETIVRKTRGTKDSELNTDEQENRSPCPYCNFNLPDMEVNCTQCKMSIPFCIATGKHVIKDDLTTCPECDFPAIRSEFMKILESETQCPMCSENITVQRLMQIDDPSSYLNTNN